MLELLYKDYSQNSPNSIWEKVKKYSTLKSNWPNIICISVCSMLYLLSTHCSILNTSNPSE